MWNGLSLLIIGRINEIDLMQDLDAINLVENYLKWLIENIKFIDNVSLKFS